MYSMFIITKKSLVLLLFIVLIEACPQLNAMKQNDFWDDFFFLMSTEEVLGLFDEYAVQESQTDEKKIQEPGKRSRLLNEQLSSEAENEEYYSAEAPAVSGEQDSEESECEEYHSVEAPALSDDQSSAELEDEHDSSETLSFEVSAEKDSLPPKKNNPIEFVSRLDQENMEILFGLVEESLLKMAIRLVYAQRYKRDLDELRCLDFINNINKWVNASTDLGVEQSALLSEKHLAKILPLLEPLLKFIEASVTNVVTLDLSGNRLTQLPEEIGLLKELKILNLAHNNLGELSNTIGDLDNLEEVNFSHNKLQDLPCSICYLARLKKIDLSYNPISQEMSGFLRLMLDQAEITF